VFSQGFNYGFVEYDDPGAAERGMATLNGRRIHNNVRRHQLHGEIKNEWNLTKNRKSV